MKRGYFVTGADPAWGVPVVAHSTKEAKRMAWAGWEGEFDCAWVDLRVSWRRGALVGDLPFGVVEDDMVAWRCKMIDYLCQWER